MIYYIPTNEPKTLFAFVTDRDIDNLRLGKTLFIDRRGLQSYTFDRIVLGHSQTDKSAQAMIEKFAGKALENVQTHEPNPLEAKCERCKAVIAEWQLDGGQCMACWRQRAAVAEHALKVADSTIDNLNDKLTAAKEQIVTKGHTP